VRQVLSPLFPDLLVRLDQQAQTPRFRAPLDRLDLKVSPVQVSRSRDRWTRLPTSPWPGTRTATGTSPLTQAICGRGMAHSGWMPVPSWDRQAPREPQGQPGPLDPREPLERPDPREPMELTGWTAQQVLLVLRAQRGRQVPPALRVPKAFRASPDPRVPKGRKASKELKATSVLPVPQALLDRLVPRGPRVPQGLRAFRE
jgi:hypothetical protein